MYIRLCLDTKSLTERKKNERMGKKKKYEETDQVKNEGVSDENCPEDLRGL